jgi:ubiquinone biosynthesis protein
VVDPAIAPRLVTDELTTLLPMLRCLPRRLERIASAAEHGRLSIQVRLFADQRDRRHLTGLLHQVLLAILAATVAAWPCSCSAPAAARRSRPRSASTSCSPTNLLVVCAILALRVLVLIFRPDR